VRENPVSQDAEHRAVDLAAACATLQEFWQPRVVAELNDYRFKVARLHGDFIWHEHPETDEAFLVLEGTLRIDLPDGHVLLGPGELYVVPRGVRHRPCAQGEVKLLLVEPSGVVNTGTEGGDRTVEPDVWI
jgi:mannose-6-phosphate isomerase-like protein (cupin superfamily)